MSAVVLEVQDLVKSFVVDGIPLNAVDGVSFQVHAGELVGLVGPSGSGKTTLLSMLAALLTPTSGEVRIDDHPVSRMPEADRVRLRRSRLGFTFQSNNLLSFLTVQENVEMMLRLNGRNSKTERAAARGLLRRLGLEDHLRFFPDQLSGGQQQRVAIARALVHEPALVLADEPTAALDTERAFQVVQTLAELVHEKAGAGIMVTHDLRMCRFADRVLQMQDGKLVAEFTTRRDISALVERVA
jgi:putative ABC transport system ATP-binding protein